MRGFGLAGGILGAWVLAAISAPWLPLDSSTVELPRILASPLQAGGLGRDELGRSVLARVVSGARVSLLVGVVVVGVSAVIGLSVGLLAGYFGGWIDRLASRIIEVFLAFPGMLLAIGLAAVLGPGLGNTVLALSAMGWVGFARLARGQTLSLVTREHIQAARALGVGDLAVIRRHLLPLVAAPALVEASFGMAGAIVAEAGLSYLGLGVQPPAASWGSMIRDGVRYMLVAPHLVLVPGLALSAVVMAINLAGDRLRDRLDVRLNERRNW